jgi:hypothetical protein
MSMKKALCALALALLAVGVSPEAQLAVISSDPARARAVPAQPHVNDENVQARADEP